MTVMQRRYEEKDKAWDEFSSDVGEEGGLRRHWNPVSVEDSMFAMHEVAPDETPIFPRASESRQSSLQVQAPGIRRLRRTHRPENVG